MQAAVAAAMKPKNKFNFSHLEALHSNHCATRFMKHSWSSIYSAGKISTARLSEKSLAVVELALECHPSPQEGSPRQMGNHGEPDGEEPSQALKNDKSWVFESSIDVSRSTNAGSLTYKAEGWRRHVKQSHGNAMKCRMLQDGHCISTQAWARRSRIATSGQGQVLPRVPSCVSCSMKGSWAAPRWMSLNGCGSIQHLRQPMQRKELRNKLPNKWHCRSCPPGQIAIPCHYRIFLVHHYRIFLVQINLMIHDEYLNIWISSVSELVDLKDSSSFKQLQAAFWVTSFQPGSAGRSAETCHASARLRRSFPRCDSGRKTERVCLAMNQRFGALGFVVNASVFSIQDLRFKCSRQRVGINRTRICMGRLLCISSDSNDSNVHSKCLTMFDQCQSETLQDVVIWPKQDSAVLFVWIESGGWTSHSGSTSCQVGTKATKGPHWPFFGAQSLTNTTIVAMLYQASSRIIKNQHLQIVYSTNVYKSPYYYSAWRKTVCTEFIWCFSPGDLGSFPTSGPLCPWLWRLRPSGAWPRWSYGAPPFRSLSPPGDVGSMWGLEALVLVPISGSLRFLGSSQKPLKKTIQNLHCRVSMSFNAVWLESQLARFHLRRAEWFSGSRSLNEHQTLWCLEIFGQNLNHPASIVIGPPWCLRVVFEAGLRVSW